MTDKFSEPNLPENKTSEVHPHHKVPSNERVHLVHENHLNHKAILARSHLGDKAHPVDIAHAGNQQFSPGEVRPVDKVRRHVAISKDTPDSALQVIGQKVNIFYDAAIRTNGQIADTTGLPQWAPATAFVATETAIIVVPKIKPQIRDAYNGLKFHMLATAASAPNESGVEFHGAMTPEFRSGIIEGYQQIPESIRNYLHERGTRISIGATRDDIHPEYGKTYQATHLDDSRVHQNQAGGAYFPYRNEVVVTQLEYNTQRRPEIGERPDMRGIAAGNWRLQSAQAATNVLRHEVGHALDAAWGDMSNSPGFRQAYEADVAALGGADAARKKGWGYFIRDETTYPGSMEVMAEGFAASNGGGAMGTGIKKGFPKSVEWIKEFQAKFEQAYTTGGARAVNELIHKTRYSASYEGWGSNSARNKTPPVGGTQPILAAQQGTTDPEMGGHVAPSYATTPVTGNNTEPIQGATPPSPPQSTQVSGQKTAPAADAAGGSPSITPEIHTPEIHAPELHEPEIHGKGGVIGTVVLTGAVVGAALLNGATPTQAAQVGGQTVVDGLVPGAASGFTNLTQKQSGLDRLLNWADTSTATVATSAGVTAAVTSPLALTGGGAVVPVAAGITAGVATGANIAVGLISDGLTYAGFTQRGGIIHSAVDLEQSYVTGIHKQLGQESKPASVPNPVPPSTLATGRSSMRLASASVQSETPPQSGKISPSNQDKRQPPPAVPDPVQRVLYSPL